MSTMRITSSSPASISLSLMGRTRQNTRRWPLMSSMALWTCLRSASTSLISGTSSRKVVMSCGSALRSSLICFRLVRSSARLARS